MSIGSFLSGIWQHIKDWFDKIDDDLKNAIHVGVTITEKIKDFMDSPVADIITQIIPGDLDETIKLKLREAIPKILIELKLAEQCVNLTDTNEVVACAIKILGETAGDFKSAFLHDISILIAQVVADGKLSWADGVYITQYFYDHKFKK